MNRPRSLNRSVGARWRRRVAAMFLAVSLLPVASGSALAQSATAPPPLAPVVAPVAAAPGPVSLDAGPSVVAGVAAVRGAVPAVAAAPSRAAGNVTVAARIPAGLPLTGDGSTAAALP